MAPSCQRLGVSYAVSDSMSCIRRARENGSENRSNKSAAALRKLSAEYERERTQHSPQITNLRQQVEYSAGPLTRLTANYAELAATLLGCWN